MLGAQQEVKGQELSIYGGLKICRFATFNEPLDPDLNLENTLLRSGSIGNGIHTDSNGGALNVPHLAGRLYPN